MAKTIKIWNGRAFGNFNLFTYLSGVLAIQQHKTTKAMSNNKLSQSYWCQKFHADREDALCAEYEAEVQATIHMVIERTLEEIKNLFAFEQFILTNPF